jgi:mannosyltransferase OCH1-like enzyme
MIPQIIWQTYKSSLPPHASIESIQSWLKKNPHYAWYYFDDAKCNQFIRDHFDDEFYIMYNSLPFGVMKADVWRVAIVYVYGGIYTDIDTICLTPIAQWINLGDLIVMVETLHGSLANFSFAASAKHPALYTVLKTFLQLYNEPNFLNRIEKTPTPIQNFGAHAFSYGILKHYNLDNKESMSKGANYYNSMENVIKDKTRFLGYQENRFSPIPNGNSYIYHQTASVFWNKDYNSWRNEQKQVLGV